MSVPGVLACRLAFLIVWFDRVARSILPVAAAAWNFEIARVLAFSLSTDGFAAAKKPFRIVKFEIAVVFFFFLVFTTVYDTFFLFSTVSHCRTSIAFIRMFGSRSSFHYTRL